VRPISLSANGNEVKAGNEVVLFRHEKRFFSPAGIFLRVYDGESADAIREKVTAVANYSVEYVGIPLKWDGIAVQADSGNFAGAVAAVRDVSHLPLILIAKPAELEEVLPNLSDGKALIAFATEENWQEMAALAQKYKTALAVRAASIDAMAALSEKINQAGVADIVLAPEQRGLLGSLTANTTMRRLALKQTYRALGYPILNIPGDATGPEMETMLAAQAIGKYGSFVVLDHFQPETAYPLLVLRQNIFTDPQKPVQVQPGLYEINDPGENDPVLVTTNFSITYFSVANEVESAGCPAWLLVCDAEGMSVLTAWAAGKFDAERIAKDVKLFGVADKVTRKLLVLPGHVAVLTGEVEEELPGWDVRVGPREAVHIPAFLKRTLAD
jgi:acetyl-CoA decarbonylase/synthase complex subunit gamma